MVLDRLFRLYQKHKVVNVNVNVIVAGLMAIVISKLPVLWVSTMIGPGAETWRKVAKIVCAAAIDGAADVLIYFLLHWIANHWKPRKPRDDEERNRWAEEARKFWKTASLVQVERYLLSPVFYTIAMGGMWALMEFRDWTASWSFVTAFSAAILVTRVIHTIWGLKTGRFK
ncbi:MAG: hypothetical protein H6811_03860 [Phycisphaeraceae bacterium]|nr:hypothetical protein [Phycisphaeraceae bacterium]